MSNDLYGALSRSLQDVKSAVEKSIGCRMEARESTYQGGEYFKTNLLNGETIVCKHNIDPFDGEPVESKFPRYPTIVYVNDTARSRAIESAFRKARPALKLLRRK